MYIVYALKSVIKNFLYVGMTNNLERRLSEHQSGHNRSTMGFAPFVLVFQETFTTRVEARKREKYLKSGSGKEYLKTVIPK